jgi:hypothetical protein
VKGSTEQAALTLRVLMNLHLSLYRETAGHFENKDFGDKFCLPRRETYHSRSGRIKITVVKNIQYSL